MRRLSIDAYLLPSDDLKENILYLKNVAKIKVDLSRTRCPKCNTILSLKDRSELNSSVPEKYWTVFYCPKCSSTYWFGGHFNTLNDLIEELF